MELVEIRLCFKPNRFNGSDLLKLLEIENFLGFSPTRFSSGSLNNNNYRISYDSKNLDRLKNVKNRLKITVETDSDFGAQFHLFDAGKSFGGQILYVLRFLGLYLAVRNNQLKNLTKNIIITTLGKHFVKV